MNEYNVCTGEFTIDDKTPENIWRLVNAVPVYTYARNGNGIELARFVSGLNTVETVVDIYDPEYQRVNPDDPIKKIIADNFDDPDPKEFLKLLGT